MPIALTVNGVSLDSNGVPILPDIMEFSFRASETLLFGRGNNGFDYYRQGEPYNELYGIATPAVVASINHPDREIPKPQFRRSTRGGVFRGRPYHEWYTKQIVVPSVLYNVTFNASATVTPAIQKKRYINLQLQGGAGSPLGFGEAPFGLDPFGLGYGLALSPSNYLAPSNDLAPSDGALIGNSLFSVNMNFKSAKLMASTLTLTPSELVTQIRARLLASTLSLAVTEAPKRIYARSFAGSVAIASAIQRKISKFINFAATLFPDMVTSRGARTPVSLPASISFTVNQSAVRKFNIVIAATGTLVAKIVRFITLTKSGQITLTPNLLKLPRIPYALTFGFSTQMSSARFNSRALAASVQTLTDIQRKEFASRVLTTTLFLVPSEAHNLTNTQTGVNISGAINTTSSLSRNITKDLHGAIIISAVLANLPAETLSATFALSADLERKRHAGKQLALLLALNQSMGVSPTVSTKDFGFIKLVSAVLVSK